MPTKKPENEEIVELILNNNLPVVTSDNLSFYLRADDVCLLRLSTQLPEGLLEQARIMINKERLIDMIDVICSNINYYPVKPKAKKKTSTKK